ncbi:hypothetical protein QJQ45_014093 [Haematococcus lacustris]|nr:hypothetical protein QJQ45_014093 [Haematococcus lacustris]
MMRDAGMLGVLTEEGVTSFKKFRNGALPDPARPGHYIEGPKDSHVANRWDALLPDPRRQKLASPKHNFAQIVHTDGVTISVMFLRPKPAAPPAELPRMGQGNPLAHLHSEWLGVDPGKTNMATVAHEERSAAGTVMSVRHWKLTAGQYYRDSGITRQAQATKTWLAKVKPQLTALSRVSSKPSSLTSYRRFADTVLATHDAMWAEVSKQRWANAKFRLYCGKMRVVKKQAQKRWPDRILALAYGAASFSGSGSVACRGSSSGQGVWCWWRSSKPAAPPAELPRMGQGNPLAHLHSEWLGVDPGKTNMATVAHEERSAAGTVVSVRHWKLTAGQYYRDSGITRQAQATKTWLAKVKPQLTALSRVSSKPSSLTSYRRFADTVLATHDAMWAEVSKQRWANAKFRLYCGKMRVVKKQAQKRWPDRILALAYGAASFSGSGSVACRGSSSGQGVWCWWRSSKPAAPPAELPRMGQGNPLAHLHSEWLGVDPGKTNMATVAHEERSAAGTVVSVRHWKLTAGQYYRDSGITRQAQATKTWLAKVKPQLTALSRVSSKPSSLTSYRRFADTVLATHDAMWAEVSKQRWANAKFRLYCGKMRVGKQFGAGRVVLVEEFRTSRVSSAYSSPSEALPGQPPESFRWLRPVYSKAKRSQVRGLMSSTSHNIRFYDRDVSAALNIRRCAVGPGPRPTELCYWAGRPAMPKRGRPGQEWVYLPDKAPLRKWRRKWRQ